jgi:hypothetical protein
MKAFIFVWAPNILRERTPVGRGEAHTVHERIRDTYLPKRQWMKQKIKYNKNLILRKIHNIYFHYKTNFHLSHSLSVFFFCVTSAVELINVLPVYIKIFFACFPSHSLTLFTFCCYKLCMWVNMRNEKELNIVYQRK